MVSVPQPSSRASTRSSQMPRLPPRPRLLPRLRHSRRPHKPRVLQARTGATTPVAAAYLCRRRGKGIRQRRGRIRLVLLGGLRRTERGYSWRTIPIRRAKTVMGRVTAQCPATAVSRKGGTTRSRGRRKKTRRFGFRSGRSLPQMTRKCSNGRNLYEKV